MENTITQTDLHFGYSCRKAVYRDEIVTIISQDNTCFNVWVPSLQSIIKVVRQ